MFTEHRARVCLICPIKSCRHEISDVKHKWVSVYGTTRGGRAVTELLGRQRSVSYLRHPQWDDGAATINQPSEILFSLPVELYM